MKLHEYQAKQIFARYGIPIPRGNVTKTANDAKQIAEELGGKVVVKAQVLVSGRGKAGGIRLAKSPKEAEEIAAIVLGMDIKGLPVRRILVDEAVSISKEIYLGIVNDRASGKPIVMTSSAGGADIEEIAQRSPEKIIRVSVDPLVGLRDYQVRELVMGIDLPRIHWRPFIEITKGLWRAFIEMDATLAEINPLVISSEGKLVGLDCKMLIDDNALFRHPDLSDMRDLDGEVPVEEEARKYGLSYIKLDGDIGCMVNGAGLAMAMMDMIKFFGGEPANFLDIGGGASAEKVSAALKIILTDANVKAVIINIFGGITRCDEVAKGIVSAIDELKPRAPLVVRLVGTNAEEGMRLLIGAHLTVAESLEDAARRVVEKAKGGRDEYFD